MVTWSNLNEGYNPMAEYMAQHQAPVTDIMTGRTIQLLIIDLSRHLPTFIEIVYYVSILSVILIIGLALIKLIAGGFFKRLSRW